jgi:hypothetical protein
MPRRADDLCNNHTDVSETPLFILRDGVPVAVPAQYAQQPAHRRLVDRLTRLLTYEQVVAFLERRSAQGTDWLAADILTGAPWVRRYLLTTGLRARQPAGARLAQRGMRALVRTLAGGPRRGRRPTGPIAPAALAGAHACVHVWQEAVRAVWAADPATRVARLSLIAAARGIRSAAHHRALRVLLRRPRVRPIDVAVALASWETGVPVRRLRARAAPIVDLVYR